MILPAIILIAAIFAFLIARLASAMLKNKLREHAGDDTAHGDWPSVPEDPKAGHNGGITR